MLSNCLNEKCQFVVRPEEKSRIVGFRSSSLIAIFIVTAAGTASIAANSGSQEALCGSEGHHAKSITLNGNWEFAVGDGQE